MLNQYIEDLQNSIQWAHFDNNFDVLCLAKQKMDKLMKFVSTLSGDAQQRAHQQIDQVLPMEWPLWMEACRYQDDAGIWQQNVVFH